MPGCLQPEDRIEKQGVPIDKRKARTLKQGDVSARAPVKTTKTNEAGSKT